jgi:hypothetical protein
MPSNFFTYSPTTGTGNTIINVSANTQNTGTADNLAAITISNTANSATVELKQLYRPTFNQFASTTFPTTGGDIYFTIHSEYDVVFRSVPSWITISYNGQQYSEGERISSGVVDNKTFTLTAEANTGQSRTVSSTMNMGHYIGNTLQNYYTYFSFHQNGVVAPGSITLSPTYIEVSSAATSTTLTMTVANCTFDHMTTSSAGTFAITASGPSNNIVTLTFPANTDTASTRGYLSFYMYDTDGSAYTQTITVVRAAATAATRNMVLSPIAATVNSGVVSYTLYVPTTACTFCGMTYTNSNASFPVTAVKDGSYIRLAFSANTGSQRSTTVTFALKDELNNTYNRTFSLTQSAAPTPPTPTVEDGYISTTTSLEYMDEGILSVDVDVFSYGGYNDSTSFSLTTNITENYEDLDIQYLDGGTTQINFKVLLWYVNGQGTGMARDFDITVDYGSQSSVDTVTTGTEAVFPFNYEEDATATITITLID